MRIIGTHLLLRNEKRDTDDEVLFRWLNLEEWNYYDEPDRPFKNITRAEFENLLEERRRRAGKPSHHSANWQIDTTEALRLLIDHMFREMELDEILAATWTGNRRMISCAETCGFREVRRSPYEAAYSVRGEPLERMEFSISRREWLALRESGS